MNKEKFYEKYDKKLIDILKELPALQDLSSRYSKHAYILMIYAYFEGFVYEISLDFYNLLNKLNKADNINFNAHYNYCLKLFNKQNSKKDWQIFRKIKDKNFYTSNNDLIATNDNLGYDIFRYLLFILNINEYKAISDNFYTKNLNEKKNNKQKYYITFENIINELLQKRNDIAHGNPIIFQEKFLNEDKIQEMSESIQLVLRQLKTDIFEILENETYIN